MIFTAEELGFAAKRNGMYFPEHVLDQLVAAIDSGKHVVLTGPPGTGKTTLAYLTAEVAQRSMLCTGYLPTTATTEWTTFETIGGFQPTSEGLIFRPGMFVDAIESGRWLVIDELNRSNFDRAFGQLFTVLSGQAVVLPFKRGGRIQPISLVPPGVDPPDDTDAIRLPASWRILATMNVFDKNLLFEMSYALMRRFAFVEVTCPSDEAYHELLEGPGDVVRELLPLRRFRDLGPAVYLDAAKFAIRRLEDEPSKSRLLYEIFYAYFLPQFEGIDDEQAVELFHMMAELLDDPERSEARRTIGEVLGAALPRLSDQMYGIEPDTGTGIVLRWLARPYDPQKAVAALLGLSTRVTRQMIGVVLASSPEAEDLLDAMPRIVRSLAIATTDQPERCYGELRGPVLWSETMSARSASAGDPGLFVCATTTKAYDTDENRVLKSALHAVYGAGQAAEHTYEPVVADVVKRARHNGQSAARLLEHQTLAAVPVARVTGRALRRTRAGSRRATYRPALDLLRRAAEPVTAEHLLALADPRTRGQHDLLAATLHHLEDITGTSPILRVARGSLLAGPLAYHHPGRLGDEGATDGITINGVLLDVPDPLDGDLTAARARLEARAGTRPAILALGAEDVERAVALALTPS